MNKLTDLEVAIKLEEIEKEQETLEEAAENYDEQYKYIGGKISFKRGAEWQQERSYSEEDMREAFIAGGNSEIEEEDAYGSAYIKYMEEWFEQFKKK